ncbi:hypothetical protein QVD17_04502 [Tagetes erecta]|uniref:Miraculin n=1 Tax=Tagetes erecta TaxID=13708 RepID=A0AAD8PAS3_TARER|nr:hypothetical protein QVD17_04502 [Tagetes erecta]
MKTTIFFFSLALITLCNIFTANSAPDAVLDIYGRKASTGIEYFAMAYAIDDYGGSILSAPVANGSCPAGVVHIKPEGFFHRFTITPVNPKKTTIRVSTDVNIKFTGSDICNESNVWKVKYDEAMKQYAVMLGGVEGDPGAETLDNWFKIEKTVNGYKFVYCPSVCSNCKVMCKDVGTTIDANGVERFVLGGDPLIVNFWVF